MPDLDEGPHPPGAGGGWSEWWSFDFAQPDGVAGFVQLTRFPHRGRAWYWAYVVVPDGLVVVRDHELTEPRGPALTVRGEGIWSELLCEVAHEHWGIALEAFGLLVEADARDHERGDRVPVGLDLEWETAGAPEWVGDGERSRYTQPGRVHGELLIGARRLAIDGDGWREHGWGEPVWTTPSRPSEVTGATPLVEIAVPVGPGRALVHQLSAERRWTRVPR